MALNLPAKQIGPEIGQLLAHLGTEGRPQLGQGRCFHPHPPVAAGF